MRCQHDMTEGELCAGIGLSSVREQQVLSVAMGDKRNAYVIIRNLEVANTGKNRTHTQLKFLHRSIMYCASLHVQSVQP